MIDPQFQTRADLEAWAIDMGRELNRRLAFGEPHRRMLAQLRRVTIAHLHLPFEPQEQS
jgi:hypothetical protein